MRALSFALIAVIAIAFCVAGASATVSSSASPDIQHVVVLMLENRAFDHMCGWLNQWLGPNKIDGLTGTEYNMANGTKWFVQDSCPYVNPFDPLHDLVSTTKEMMNSTTVLNPAPMDGFAETHFQHGDPEFYTVLHGFAPHLVPAISTLAENFLIFDKWYSSVPGPTYPNRLYWHSGTSHGLDSASLWPYLPGSPQRTMFDVFNDRNISWGVYSQDVPDTLLFTNMRELKNLEKHHWYDKFLTDAGNGTLPTYSWVTPAFFPMPDHPARDQHPDHDVVLGEEMIAEVYAAVRNSPLWNKTLLVVTYDEHGGFYDHVSPPEDKVPSPDGIIAEDTGFTFERLGIRVPTILVSPWVPKGVVVGEPSDPTRHYEHSSMYATLLKMFDLGGEQLTNRTSWAYPFHDLFTETAPRTDCPTSVPTPADTPERREAVLKDQLARPPNGLQKQFFGMAEAALGRYPDKMTLGAHLKNQHDMGQEMMQMLKTIFKK